MSNSFPIPTPDPMPLPGPVWLMMVLLLVTFLLHLIAMNLTAGGTAIAAMCAARRKRDAFAGRLADDLLRILPFSLAFTITLGVAALLFVQVLYGNLLYASSILIGAFWAAVIPTLIVAYYGLYYSKSHPSRSGWLWLSLFLMLAIGFVYVNNFTLMLSPQRWLAMYRHSAAGLNLNWGDPSLIPRYLHFMLGAFAIAGLIVFAAGVWKRSTEYGQWMLLHGSQWFVVPTVLNYAVGMWFLLALPRTVPDRLVRGQSAGSFSDWDRHAATACGHRARGAGCADREDIVTRSSGSIGDAADIDGDGGCAAGGKNRLCCAVRTHRRASCQLAVECHRALPCFVCCRVSCALPHAAEGIPKPGRARGIRGQARLMERMTLGQHSTSSPIKIRGYSHASRRLGTAAQCSSLRPFRCMQIRRDS